MILQRVVFPINRQTNIETLYYRSKGDIKVESAQEIRINGHSRIDLCTFFNAFSSEKWGRYTSVKEVSVNVQLSGSGKVRLMNKTEMAEQCISEQDIENAHREWHNFMFIPTDGFYYLEMETDSGLLSLHNAFFSSDIKEQQVRLALVICTYHREDYVLNNILQIKNCVLENEESQLRDHLDIYIIDNGKTLTRSEFPMPEVRLIPNENIGGSGGFTRGLIEVLHQRTKKYFTHVVLMDDDVALDTEVLERTFAFLSSIKKEYEDAVLGGSMLHSDQPCLLQPVWNAWRKTTSANKEKLDLGEINNLFSFEKIRETDYQPWWYCCLPLSVIGLDNLPLPFFIHGDDVEFGLRNGCEIIYLNGVCVWHDSFENKRPSHLEYYDTRNYLIITSIYNDVRFSLWNQMWNCFKRSTALILRMRYKDIDLIVRGIDDFLRGPDWWKHQNITELHKQIMNGGYTFKPISENYLMGEEVVECSEMGYSRWKCLLSLNGAFFSKRSKPILLPCGCSPFWLYRRKCAYLYEQGKTKAIYVEFSMKKLVMSYLKLIAAFLRLVSQFKIVKKQYQKQFREIGTEQYWKQFF